MTVNKAILVGNLGADPETRTSQGGVTIANLRIATTERIKSGDEWVDQTEWHRVVCFGRTAESVGRFLEKGRQVYVEGRIQTRKWTDNDGNERWSTEIIANAIRFLGGGGERGGGGGGGSRSTGRAADSGGYGGADDSIPF